MWEGDFVWCEETRGGDCDEDDAYDERSQVQFRPLIYVSCQFEPGEKLFFFFLRSTEVWRRPTRTTVRQGSASYVLEEDLCPSTEDSHDCTTRSNIKAHGSTDGPWIKYAASRSRLFGPP